jgi:hypothetical protein
MGTNHNLFRQTGHKKAREPTIVFRLWIVSKIFEEFQHPAIQTKIVELFGGVFHQIKVRHSIGRKILYIQAF